MFSHLVISDSMWHHGLQHGQAPLSVTISQSLLRFMSIELVMLSNRLILCCFLLLLSVFLNIRVSSTELAICIRWSKYWSISISPANDSIQFSCSVMSDSLRPQEPQHARPPCQKPNPRVYPNPCPLNQWCHPTISSSIIPFSCLQSFPASGSFQMSQPFASGGQNIGVLASTSVLPMNTQDWSPLGWTGWICLQSKGLLSVFSNTTIQKHQFFSTQLSL